MSGHCSWISVTAASEWHCILSPPLLDSQFHSCHSPKISTLPELCASTFSMQSWSIDCLSPRFKPGQMPGKGCSDFFGFHYRSQSPARCWAAKRNKNSPCMLRLCMTSFPIFWYIYFFFPFALKKIISSVYFFFIVFFSFF